MFFLAALRHLRIPARKRVGFDWDGWIHEIVEYWDDGRGQWILIDPNPATRQPIRDFLAKVGAEGSDSDLEVIRPGEAFTPGALAWRLCRTGQAEASRFKLVGHEGLSGVRVALLQDLDSVNKIELRTFDEWHSLYAAPFDELGDDTLHWFDAAAALVDDHDTGIDDLQAFYATSPHGAAVRTRLHKLVMNGAPS